jgi:hypothetical protein
MKISRAALLAVAALALGVAGCDSSTDTPGASGSTSPTAAATTASTGSGTSGACVVGTWKSTGFTGSFDQAGTTGTINGGAGYTLVVAPDGATTVDFAGMSPVQFAAKVSGTDVKGSFTYGGKVVGAVKLPASGTSGNWEPTGTSDFKALTVKLSLTAPVALDLPSQSIADLAGMSQVQVGSAIDAQPVLKNGTYKCEGNTLTLGPPAGTTVGGTWAYQKA